MDRWPGRASRPTGRRPVYWPAPPARTSASSSGGCAAAQASPSRPRCERAPGRAGERWLRQFAARAAAALVSGAARRGGCTAVCGCVVSCQPGVHAGAWGPGLRALQRSPCPALLRASTGVGACQRLPGPGGGTGGRGVRATGLWSASTVLRPWPGRVRGAMTGSRGGRDQCVRRSARRQLRSRTRRPRFLPRVSTSCRTRSPVSHAPRSPSLAVCPRMLHGQCPSLDRPGPRTSPGRIAVAQC
jgi:hypothetical protein